VRRRTPRPGGAAVAGADAGGDAVAWSDGAPSSRAALARAVGQAARERGGLDLDEPTRAALLERLIDEELLLREGLALGLAAREPVARRAIVSAVIEGVAAAEGEPDRAALEALYAETRDQWRRPGALQAEAALVRVPPGGGAEEDTAARARAEALAAAAREGASLDALARAEGAVPPLPPPAEPLPLDALRERIAGAAVEALLRLAPGAVSEPVRSAEGWWVVRLVARGPDEAPPVDGILPELRTLWIQRQHERALRDHLATLRARADIRYAEP
jgi:hypothetical protein